MIRKLVRQGSSTLMISLPSKWIKANNLNKGSEVGLEEVGNSIVLKTELKDKKELVIEINEENKKDIKNLLTHAYRKGFDKMVLKNAKEYVREIKLVVNDLLLGFEITEYSNILVIENISEPTHQKYELLLKKAFQIIEETQEIIMNDFEENSFKHTEDIQDLKKQQDRFLLFCRRLLIKNDVELSLINNWEVLNFLMHIEHRYYYLYKHASESKINKNKDVISLLNETIRYFQLYREAFYNSDISAIHKINNLRGDFYFGKCVTALKKSKSDDSVILSYIREIFRIIQLGTSPILSELLEKQIR